MTCWFDRSRNPDRSWKVDQSAWSFSASYVGETPTWRIVHDLQLLRPDVIFMQYHALRYVAALLAGRSMGMKVGHRVLGESPWFQTNALRRAVKKSLLASAAFVQVPGPSTALLAQSYGVAADRVFNVHQSIDVAHYASAMLLRQRESHHTEGHRFLYVGRLCRGKGLDLLLDAFLDVERSYPDSRLTIVGDGVLMAHARERARHSQRIDFAGFIDKTDLVHYLAEAHTLVFPTLGDPYGLVVDEAIAAGLRVVASSAAGDIEVRLEKGRGRLVRAGDADALKEAMVSEIVRGPVRSDAFSAGSLGTAGWLPAPHEVWVSDVMHLVQTVSERPPPGGWPSFAFRALGVGLRGIASSLARCRRTG